jgi:hypothetical protein
MTVKATVDLRSGSPSPGQGSLADPNDVHGGPKSVDLVVSTTALISTTWALRMSRRPARLLNGDLRRLGSSWAGDAR